MSDTNPYNLGEPTRASNCSVIHDPMKAIWIDGVLAGCGCVQCKGPIKKNHVIEYAEIERRENEPT